MLVLVVLSALIASSQAFADTRAPSPCANAISTRRVSVEDVRYCSAVTEGEMAGTVVSSWVAPAWLSRLRSSTAGFITCDVHRNRPGGDLGDITTRVRLVVSGGRSRELIAWDDGRYFLQPIGPPERLLPASRQIVDLRDRSYGLLPASAPPLGQARELRLWRLVDVSGEPPPSSVLIGFDGLYLQLNDGCQVEAYMVGPAMPKAFS